VVDRRGQLVEEALGARRVVGVEGGAAARRELAGRPLEALRIAAGEDDLATLAAGEAGRLEPDACTAADHDDDLAEQPPFTRDSDVGCCCGHASSPRCVWSGDILSHYSSSDRFDDAATERSLNGYAFVTSQSGLTLTLCALSIWHAGKLFVETDWRCRRAGAAVTPADRQSAHSRPGSRVLIS
jgi:hypothetical protein